jgi:hypothetical protein
MQRSEWIHQQLLAIGNVDYTLPRSRKKACQAARMCDFPNPIVPWIYSWEGPTVSFVDPAIPLSQRSARRPCIRRKVQHYRWVEIGLVVDNILVGREGNAACENQVGPGSTFRNSVCDALIVAISRGE